MEGWQVSIIVGIFLVGIRWLGSKIDDLKREIHSK